MKTFFLNGKCLYKRQNFYSVFRVCLVLLIKIIISNCSLGQRGGGILWYTLVVETDFIEKAILRKRFKISLIPGGRTRKPDLFMLFVKTKQKTEIGAVLINLKSDYVIFFFFKPCTHWCLNGKESVCQCKRHRRLKFDPWVEKNPGEGKGNWLQYSCLGNPRNRKTWRDKVHQITKELDMM